MQIATISAEGRQVINWISKLSNIIANLESAPIQERNFGPAIEQLKALAMIQRRCQQEAYTKAIVVKSLKEQLGNTLFSLQNFISNDKAVPIKIPELNMLPIDNKSTETDAQEQQIFKDINLTKLKKETSKTSAIHEQNVKALMNLSREISQQTEVQKKEENNRKNKETESSNIITENKGTENQDEYFYCPELVISTNLYCEKPLIETIHESDTESDVEIYDNDDDVIFIGKRKILQHQSQKSDSSLQLSQPFSQTQYSDEETDYEDSQSQSEENNIESSKSTQSTENETQTSNNQSQDKGNESSMFDTDSNNEIDINHEIKIFYEETIEKISKVESNKELSNIMDEASKSKYFGYFKNTKLDMHIYLESEVLRNGIINTGALPSTAKYNPFCGYPGCTHKLARTNDRKPHLRDAHGLMPENIPISYANQVIAIAGLFTKWKAYIESEHKLEECCAPIDCPVCKFIKNENFFTSDFHGMNNHILGLKKDPDHKKIKQAMEQYGSFWGTTIYLMKEGIKVKANDFINPRKGFKCPLCDFVASTNAQVKSHLSQKHKETMRENQVEGVECTIQTLYETKPFSKLPLPQQQTNREVERRKLIFPVTIENNELTQEKDNDNQNKENEETEEIIDLNNNEEHNSQRETNDEIRINNAMNIPGSNQHSESESEEDSIAELEINRYNQNISTVSESEFQNAIEWVKKYENRDMFLPQLRRKQKKQIKNHIKTYLVTEAIPLLTKFISDRTDRENKWLAIDGVIFKIEYDIVEIVRRVLHIKSSKRIPKVNTVQELQIAAINKSRTSSAMLAKLLTKLDEYNKMEVVANDNNNNDDNDENTNTFSSEQTKNNAISRLSERAIKYVPNIKEEVSRELFNKPPCEVGFGELREFMESDDEHKQAKINWLQGSIEQDNEAIDNLTKERKKRDAIKAQELYSEDPRRAMRWYVNIKGSPQCEIPVEEVERAMLNKWAEETAYRAPEDGSVFTSKRKIRCNVSRDLQEKITNPNQFLNTIRTRSPRSANGPDGVGYGIIQTNEKEFSILMSMISKAMLEYGECPSVWDRSRSLLIYKHGDPKQLRNWRPLTISSAMYRIWTCTLSNILQGISRTSPLFSESQKGFIKGTNGCMINTATITELFADANRKNKNIWMITIDLQDAFGSISHNYIDEILKEYEFPDNIRRIIMSSYKHASTQFQIGSRRTNDIPIHKGVKQGDPLSPLLFNLCLNPLLDRLNQERNGYVISNEITINVQAYADDIILITDSYEKVKKQIATLEAFMDYSKLNTNASKCKVVSYCYDRQSKHRFADTNKIVKIKGEEIPKLDLSQYGEYLGAAIAASALLRMKSQDEKITEMKEMIKEIDESALKLNQKADALRKFTIPMLDYTLTNNTPPIKELEELDTKMRMVIAKGIDAKNIPIGYAYAHWKDGGLSLQPLHMRYHMMKLKRFLALLNCENQETKMFFRLMGERERLYRGIEAVNPDTTNFLNWKTDEEGSLIQQRRGTSSIFAATKRSADKLKLKIGYDNNKKDQDVIIQDEIGEKHNESDISQYIFKEVRKKSITDLISLPLHGHSFVNAMDNPNSNSLIGNASNRISGSIIKFMIQARLNSCYTGQLYKKFHPNAQNNSGPKCRYCSLQGDGYTLEHILNGCRNSLVYETRRHNMVCTEIVNEVKKKFRRANITENSEVTINGRKVRVMEGDTIKSFKPDIIIYESRNPIKITMVEVMVPYDCVHDTNNRENDTCTTLERAYNMKTNKYKNLVDQCLAFGAERVRFAAFIVSSLGVVYNKSVNELRQILHISEKKMNQLERRISTAAIIGSYCIFYGLNKKPITIDEDVNGNLEAEEPPENQPT